MELSKLQQLMATEAERLRLIYGVRILTLCSNDFYNHNDDCSGWNITFNVLENPNWDVLNDDHSEESSQMFETIDNFINNVIVTEIIESADDWLFHKESIKIPNSQITHHYFGRKETDLVEAMLTYCNYDNTINLNYVQYAY